MEPHVPDGPHSAAVAAELHEVLHWAAHASHSWAVMVPEWAWPWTRANAINASTHCERKRRTRPSSGGAMKPAQT